MNYRLKISKHFNGSENNRFIKKWNKTKISVFVNLKPI